MVWLIRNACSVVLPVLYIYTTLGSTRYPVTAFLAFFCIVFVLFQRPLPPCASTPHAQAKHRGGCLGTFHKRGPCAWRGNSSVSCTSELIPTGGTTFHPQRHAPDTVFEDLNIPLGPLLDEAGERWCPAAIFVTPLNPPPPTVYFPSYYPMSVPPLTVDPIFSHDWKRPRPARLELAPVLIVKWPKCTKRVVAPGCIFPSLPPHWKWSLGLFGRTINFCKHRAFDSVPQIKKFPKSIFTPHSKRNRDLP